MTVSFAKESLSLFKPAWDSLSPIVPTRPEDVEVGSFAYIRTAHAVYDRVKIVAVSPSSVSFTYVKMVKDKKGNQGPKVVREMLRKGEIIVMRNYVD